VGVMSARLCKCVCERECVCKCVKECVCAAWIYLNLNGRQIKVISAHKSL